MYTGGAGGLGRRLRGGVQHQRPHFLHQRQEHPAADSRGARGQLQRVRGTMRLFYSEVSLTADRSRWWIRAAAGLLFQTISRDF